MLPPQCWSLWQHLLGHSPGTQIDNFNSQFTSWPLFLFYLFSMDSSAHTPLQICEIVRSLCFHKKNFNFMLVFTQLRIFFRGAYAKRIFFSFKSNVCVWCVFRINGHLHMMSEPFFFQFRVFWEVLHWNYMNYSFFVFPFLFVSVTYML